MAARHSALAAVAAAPLPAARSVRAGEDGEAPLLRVVEAAVERLGRFGEPLEHGAAFRQTGGALAHALGRIGDRAAAFAARFTDRGDAVEAKLLELAHRLLERRPMLLLLGSERQSGAQRSKPRGLEGAHVLGGGLPAACAVRRAHRAGHRQRWNRRW